LWHRRYDLFGLIVEITESSKDPVQPAKSVDLPF
jgi:hypothetical protein